MLHLQDIPIFQMTIDACLNSAADEVKEVVKRGHSDEEGEVSKKARSSGIFDDLGDQLQEKWKVVLGDELKKPYFCLLVSRLNVESAQKKEIFPPHDKIMKCFALTPFDEVKVVIIGQDPYHDDGQAEGLCFSVPKGMKKPSSLNNIFKELKSDIDCFDIPNHGNLSSWAEQGVLLLNTSLTVEAHKANSHKDFGWQLFTSAVLKKLNKEREGIVFLLWGKQAQKKCEMIDRNRHHVLMAPHPSGLSAHRGFFGCKHFSKTNVLLQKMGKSKINWRIL